MWVTGSSWRWERLQGACEGVAGTVTSSATSWDTYVSSRTSSMGDSCSAASVRRSGSLGGLGNSWTECSSALFCGFLCGLVVVF